MQKLKLTILHEQKTCGKRKKTAYDGYTCYQHIHLIFLLASIGYICEEVLYYLE